MWNNRKPTLLLVEDNSSTQAALVRLFRSEFDVTATSSPIKALELIQNGFEPAIIFSDYIMPELSGIELLEKSKEISPSSMRIILTGHLATADFSKAMSENTLHRVLMKPWENDLLLFQMQEVVKQHEMLKEKNRLERLAVTDSVTGLFNHRYFQDCLHREVERALRHNRMLSLILVDVDSFKDVNDSQGHPQGDLVLKQVSQILKRGVRNIDIVCRYGGDEFAIVLPDTEDTGAREVAERIRLDFNKSKDKDANISLSLGVAQISKQINETGLLIEFADKALYQAKRNGKNQTVVADKNNFP